VRVTIVPVDTTCSVDGIGYSGIDMSSIRPEVHAVQWYDTWGEEEIKDPITNRSIANIPITSLDAYEEVLASYWRIRNAEEAAREELIVSETIFEV
jgi:hypothetical protein